MPQGHDVPAANASEWTDDHPKEMEECVLAAPVASHSISPEHSVKSWAPEGDQVGWWLWQRYPTAHSGAEHQAEHHALQVLQPQPERTLLPVYAGEYLPTQAGKATPQAACPSPMSPPGWQCHSGPPPVQPALSSGQDTRANERSPQARLYFNTHRRATTKPLLPGHTLPKHKMSLPHSVTGPFRVAGWVPTGCRWTGNQLQLQKDSARQVVMSVALNRKHFELFWYNGKLWERERKRTG